MIRSNSTGGMPPAPQVERDPRRAVRLAGRGEEVSYLNNGHPQYRCVYGSEYVKGHALELQEAQAAITPDDATLQGARDEIEAAATAQPARYRAALDAGGDLVTISQWINEARLQQAAAQNRLA
ncbi:hypothetical protein [Kitasatospora sp. LaBMicrA B282]|uniref:hypothetical protein n=1 Tax=Kitasatospora sp. LaBMicrA B282 TaxID=3420949 RepID=UPI003D140F24